MTARLTPFGGAPPTLIRCNDWSGADYKTTGARPGDKLYTIFIIALDPDTGKLKFYHQELPRDTWDPTWL
jgi:glucose dehydrogenase